jgi:hypothetical protein
VSAGKVGALDLKSLKITAAVLPRRRLRRPGLQWPPPVTAGGPRLEAARFRSCRSPELLGPKQRGKRNYLRVGLMRLGLNFLKARGPHRVLINVRGDPDTLMGAIKRRCPSRLGSRAMPGSLGRASEWLLSVKATGDSSLQGKFCKHPASDWWACV